MAQGVDILFGRCSQPQPGGSFHLLPEELLNEFRVLLLEFAELKTCSANPGRPQQQEQTCIATQLVARTTLGDLKEVQELLDDDPLPRFMHEHHVQNGVLSSWTRGR